MVDSALNLLKQSIKPNLSEILIEIRSQRGMMVETVEQYIGFEILKLMIF